MVLLYQLIFNHFLLSPLKEKEGEWNLNNKGIVSPSNLYRRRVWVFYHNRYVRLLKRVM